MAKPDKPSNLRRMRAFFAILALAALGVGGYVAWTVFRGIELPQAPLANVPRSATIVGYIRVGTVVNSDVVRSLVSRELFEARLERIRERCGFDPAAQIDDAILFVDATAPREIGKIGVVARGPFEHEKLSRCFRDAFREEGLGAMRMMQIDGVPAVAPAEGAQRAAFLGRRGIAIGDEPTVRQVIGVVRDSEASATGDRVLARLWDRVASGRDIVLIGHVPPNWQQSVRDLAGVDPDVAVRQILNNLKAFGVGVTFSNGLQIGGVLGMRDQASATSLANDTRQQLEALSGNLMVSLTPLGPIVRAIRTEQHGQDFVVTLDLPRDRLDRVLQFMEAWAADRRQRAQDPGTGANAPAPTPSVIPSP